MDMNRELCAVYITSNTPCFAAVLKPIDIVEVEQQDGAPRTMLKDGSDHCRMEPLLSPLRSSTSFNVKRPLVGDFETDYTSHCPTHWSRGHMQVAFQLGLLK